MNYEYVWHYIRTSQKSVGLTLLMESGILIQSCLFSAQEILSNENKMIKTHQINHHQIPTIPVFWLISVSVYLFVFPLSLCKTCFCTGCIAFLPLTHANTSIQNISQPRHPAHTVLILAWVHTKLHFRNGFGLRLLVSHIWPRVKRLKLAASNSSKSPQWPK